MPDQSEMVVAEYAYWTVYLNHYQSYLGRCYIALKREGNLDPFLDCTEEEWAELRSIISDKLVSALQRLFAPDMMNYDNLRNVWPHCHWHVVPRYSSERTFAETTFTDANWGANWSPYDKIMHPPEVLLAIKDALRKELLVSES